MSRETLGRLVRRALVLGMTLAVIGVGFVTVQVAADWRAAAAPLDAAPVGMDTINAQLVSETQRTSDLSGQIGSVAGQVATLEAALVEANQHVSGDADSAATLKQQLADARTKLDALQAQLRAAQDRLAALNQAAARQAALNAAAVKTSTTTTTHTGGDGGD